MSNKKNSSFKTVLIETNQSCNLNCDFCFYRDYGRMNTEITLNQLKTILNKFPNINKFYLTGGECTKNKEIAQIVEYLSVIGEVNIFTNGYLLNTNLETYRKLENLSTSVFLTVHGTDYGELNFEDLQNVDKSKTVIKININLKNYKNIEQIINHYTDLGFNKFSFNFIHNINSSSCEYELSEDLKSEILNNLIKFEKFIDVNNIKFQINSLKDSDLKNTGKCGTEFLYIGCDGKIYNCPSAMDINCTSDCKTCTKFSKECISLWEMF